jgi:S1-C subfamily serine protease
MNPIEITPRLRELEQIKLRKKARTASYAFFGVMVTPILIFLLYYFGVIASVKKGEYEDLEQAVGLVTTNSGSGTAFLVSPTKLLTAKHVVEGVEIGETVDILFERVEPTISVKATLTWKDGTPAVEGAEYFLTDIAVLSISDASILQDIIPLTLGNSVSVTNLSDVIAIGYPMGSYSISKGQINATDVGGVDLFKLDATINPGNSGGPLILDSDGTVIGMLVGQRAGDVQGENVANKIDRIMELTGAAGVNIFQ